MDQILARNPTPAYFALKHLRDGKLDTGNIAVSILRRFVADILKAIIFAITIQIAPCAEIAKSPKLVRGVVGGMLVNQ